MLNVSDSLSGSLPKQNTKFEAFFLIYRERRHTKREQILLLLNGVTVIFFFFPMNTFYCLVVVKIEMETQLWLEIVLLCGTELNRYSTTMCLLFFL